jgi:hypothetical protein
MLRYANIAEDRAASARDQVHLELGSVFIGAC